MNKDPNLVFRCPPEMREAVEAYAKVNDLSIAQVVRKALREFFERLGRQGE